MKLKFNSQAAFDTILEFKGCIDINFSFETYNRIYSSSVVFKDGMIYWMDNDEVDLERMREYSYIGAKNLRWKFVLKEENDW